jgi:uncharacterized membrane protein YGL010W/sterol desaturase/sphingolipid hydroxylase (fatty acid hydroxylase superfamily)
MTNPLIKYRTYHTNKVNIFIHQFCVPLLLLSIYSVFPIYLSICINLFYSATYLLFDVFSRKSIHSVYYLQTIFLFHFAFRNFLSVQSNMLIHGFAWIFQIIGHKWFENNSPAFLNNLYDSFLFGPYFTFLETFYPTTFETNDSPKYTIIKNDYDGSKKSIIYFAGLFQKSHLEYANISKDLHSFNHIYVNVNFLKNDCYKDTLAQIIEEEDLGDIECIIGFSFGGSLSMQFKELYLAKKELRNILISPGGFCSDTYLEQIIKHVGGYLYSFFKNDKWFMISNYPSYQNTNTLTDTDYLIVSTSDHIHNPKLIKNHKNTLLLQHVSHLNMVSIVHKRRLILQLIKNDYSIESVEIKSLTNSITKLLFGGHFYPYHISLWSSVSLYNLYYFVQTEHCYSVLIGGFLSTSFLYSLIDYFAHRTLFHKYFYSHHKKHHIYPNKLSIIHSPMIIVTGSMYFVSLLISYIFTDEYYMIIHIIAPIYYLLFEFTHLLSHNYKGTNKIILNAKYFHKLHHIDENTNYGFITPFWDYLLGTLSPKYKMGVTELIFGFIPFYSFIIHTNSEI